MTATPIPVILTVEQWKEQLLALHPTATFLQNRRPTARVSASTQGESSTTPGLGIECPVGFWATSGTHCIYVPETPELLALQTQEAIALAWALHNAAALREGSFDHVAADVVDKELEAHGELERNILLPIPDYSKFYKTSLRDACEQADVSLSEPVFLLLHYSWNDALDWSDRVLSYEKSAAIYHDAWLAARAASMPSFTGEGDEPEGKEPLGVTYRMSEVDAVRDEVQGRAEMDAADTAGERFRDDEEGLAGWSRVPGPLKPIKLRGIRAC